MNVTGPHWSVNIGSGNSLVPSGNKPLQLPYGITRPQWVNAAIYLWNRPPNAAIFHCIGCIRPKPLQSVTYHAYGITRNWSSVAIKSFQYIYIWIWLKCSLTGLIEALAFHMKSIWGQVQDFNTAHNILIYQVIYGSYRMCWNFIFQLRFMYLKIGSHACAELIMHLPCSFYGIMKCQIVLILLFISNLLYQLMLYQYLMLTLWISLFNLYPPSAAYTRQWIKSALVQIMACRPFGAISSSGRWVKTFHNMVHYNILPMWQWPV